MAENDNRRPLTTRGAGWAKWLASALVRTNISPNQISVLSVVPAIAGAWLLMCPNALAASPWLLVLVVLCIQLRLLCNMLDGMVAIEGGKQSSVGVLYNEIPDRVADSLFIVALGYAISMPWLGWLGALLAAKTAYIRVLGGANGLAQDFRGPMAKQHRMATMSLGCLLGAAELYLNATQYALIVAAYVIAIGAGLTCITRTMAIVQKLRQK